MAGLIDVGILKPELAGSFAAGYRGAEEQRNTLAQRQQQAAQAEQQLASGRQKLQMDEMTMQRLREDRAALTGLRAKLRAAGQSDDPQVFFRVMAESDDPNIMMKGIEGLQRYRALEAYDREFGPRAGAPAMPSSAPNAMVAPSTPAPRVERGVDAYGKPFESEVGGGIAPPGAMGQPLAPLDTSAPVAPATPAPVNALAPVAPAAPAPVNALSPAAPPTPNIDALRRQYSMAVAAGRSDAPVLLKQIEAALRGEQAKTPKITVLGVAKGTETPVYFDEYTNQQFTIGAGPSGQQVRVPYMGGVNRSTSTVTATATSTGGKLEGAEQKGKGELNVKQYGDIATAARLAAKTLPAMETQAKILDQGFTTGFGTEVKKAGASVLAALGVQNAEKFATNAQTFIAATQQAVLQKQLEQKGTQTAADADRITQTGAQLGNTVNGNRFIIDVAKAQLKRDMDQREFYDKWWSNKKTYEGAEDAWYASEGGKSLFDRPELKKYAASTAAETNQRQQGLADIFGGKK